MPTIAVDFDGVIHRYSQGYGDGTLYDRETPGWWEWYLEAIKHFDVVIYTSRATNEASINEVYHWLAWSWRRWCLCNDKNEDFLDYPAPKITAVKPPAIAYIDDRALQFTGCWDALKPKYIKRFKAWWEEDVTYGEELDLCSHDREHYYAKKCMRLKDELRQKEKALEKIYNRLSDVTGTRDGAYYRALIHCLEIAKVAINREER